jgi:aerobic carbon-monoxide dehydrogenase small subunit
MRLSLRVNGEDKKWEVEPGEFLSETLRRNGYDSVKTGCGVGSCGLCTVWLDGSPVLSCSTLSLRVEGHEVTTLEGVQEEAKVFGSFLVAEGADQCGFCSPGFVMLVLAMRHELVSPTEEEIRTYLVGNLCRCTGYFGRLRAVKAYLHSGR